MGTAKPNQTTRYGVHFVGLVIFYVLLLATVTGLLGPVVFKFAAFNYVPDPGFRRTIAELLIIYVLFCYFGNNFILHIYDKPKKLLISMAIDYLIVPLAIALTMLYNKLTVKDHMLSIADIYNIYIVTGLQVIKVLIASRILAPKKA